MGANQFDNVANRQGHYSTTGPEILRDTGGEIDAFVAVTGTGGTLGGVGRYVKEQRPSIRVVLADPQGSALYQRLRLSLVRSELSLHCAVRDQNPSPGPQTETTEC